MDVEIILSAVLLCLGVTYAVRRFSIRFNVISQSDFRRDGRKIPLLGGFAVFTSLACVISYFLPLQSILPILCATPLVLFGFIDDIKEISPKFKFAAQVSSAIGVLYILPQESLFLNSLGFHHVLTYVLSFFWIIGLCNAVNFIDGVDGQATSYALVVFITLFMTSNNPTTTQLLLAAMGVSTAFLIFNSPPARIFLGEIGASLLGFLIGYFTIVHSPSNPEAFNLLGILFLAAFPLTDVILSVSRRLKKRLTPFSGDKDHIHHKLRKIGLSSTKTFLVSAAVTAFCGFSAFVLSRVTDVVVGTTLGFMFTVALVAVLVAIYYLEFRLGHQISKYSKTLIDKHLHPHSNVTFDPENFHAVVIDLLPYYKELQQAGFPVVDAFILKFSQVVKKFSLDRGQIQSAGIYSVVVVFEGRAWTEIEKKRLEKSLFKLTKDFGVVKNATERPDGLYYFSTENPNKYVRILDNRRIGIKRKAS